MKTGRRIIFISTILLAALASGCRSTEDALPPGLTLLKGDVNGALIKSGTHRLVVYGDPGNQVKDADMILFTHARRDVLWAGKQLVKRGTKAVVPKDELSLFTANGSFWAGFELARFHDYSQQSIRVPSESMEVFRAVGDGDTILWRGIPIRVIGSRGYTRGAVSYLIRLDGRNVVFTGDLIFGDGQIIDLYSLQDSIAKLNILGYHGYAARTADLIRSLEEIAAMKPDILVPVHGPVIYEPQSAIRTLIGRLRSLYRSYMSVNAFRWYTGQEKQDQMAARILPSDMPVDWMPLAETGENPSWLLHHTNSKLILSEDSTAFLVDCGLPFVYKDLVDPGEQFPFTGIGGIFITHYHDDHTDYVNALREQYGCPVYCTAELQDILERPGAYRLPCMSGDPIRDLTVVPEAFTMDWKEFRFTFYYLPGQTLYHDAMLVEHADGEKIFFVGDSFSPSGIDDYCMANRNFIREGTGYLYCLNMLGELPEDTWIVNQHIEPPFRFSPSQISFMRDKILERIGILEKVLPWDDLNYGTDEGWARFYPYAQEIRPGSSAGFSLVIMNHSKQPREFTLSPLVGKGLSVDPPSRKLSLDPGTEGRASFTVSIADSMKPGPLILTADITMGEQSLHEWCESLLLVSQ